MEQTKESSVRARWFPPRTAGRYRVAPALASGRGRARPRGGVRMVTVDCHLHLTESADRAPLWWMVELYGPYGGSTSGPTGRRWSASSTGPGVDMGMVQGSDIRRTTYHPGFPEQGNLFVSNDYTAAQVSRFSARLIRVANIDALRHTRAGVTEQQRLRRGVQDPVFVVPPDLPELPHRLTQRSRLCSRSAWNSTSSPM